MHIHRGTWELIQEPKTMSAEVVARGIQVSPELMNPYGKSLVSILA